MKRDAERKARFDATRATASERGYDSKWGRYRESFLRKFPKCVMCGAPSEVVDHIKPHKGNKAFFWDKLNHQALCTHCHSSRKQRLERASRIDQRNGR